MAAMEWRASSKVFFLKALVEKARGIMGAIVSPLRLQPKAQRQ
jgi:hypothetical protein